MREIKFRAWDKENKEMSYFDLSGKTIYGYEGEVSGIILPNMTTVLMYNETGLNPNLELMQFTGLKDKNGKEIYKRDILKVKTDVVTSKCEVKCAPGHFYLSKYFLEENAMVNESFYKNNSEVIGNIYENPELIES